MPTVATAPDPLRALFAQRLAPYLAAIDEMSREAAKAEVYAAGGKRPPPVGALVAATSALGDIIAEVRQTADVIGRQNAVRAADRIVRQQGGALHKARPAAGGVGVPVPPGGDVVGGFGPEGVPGSLLPRVPFTEAVADILAREPRLVAGAEEAAAAYTAEHGFALARSSSMEVTQRVQQVIARAVATGGTVPTVTEVIAEVGDFTRAYAEMALRTNLATAYSAGRFRQMAEPAVAFAIGGLRYTAVKDVDTRPNHAACDGLIASPADPVWHRCAPPLGFNCRCSVDFVSWPELQARGLIGDDGKVRPARVPPGAHPDAGFRHDGRPDIAIYGGLLR